MFRTYSAILKIGRNKGAYFMKAEEEIGKQVKEETMRYAK
jgi:hypothetical protein